jgi:hypothetical protein
VEVLIPSTADRDIQKPFFAVGLKFVRSDSAALNIQGFVPRAFFPKIILSLQFFFFGRSKIS